MLSFVFGRFSPSPGSHGRSLGAAELELQAVGDEGDELAVRRLSLGVSHSEICLKSPAFVDGGFLI